MKLITHTKKGRKQHPVRDLYIEENDIYKCTIPDCTKQCGLTRYGSKIIVNIVHIRCILSIENGIERKEKFVFNQ